VCPLVGRGLQQPPSSAMAIEDTDFARQRRVLVYAPTGRDGALAGQLLARAGIPYAVCETLEGLATALASGAGAILFTEEALDEPGLDQLIQAIADQPAWSDLPVLLFAGSSRQHVGMRTLQRVRRLGNVTLLDRPIRLAAVLSSVESALRSRARQYELREVLIALNEAREQADAINRVKDEFLATLSHELRTPLNAMLGWASMLRSGQVQGPLAARAIEIIERNARAQHAVVSDLLDVSRIITGKLSLSASPSAVVPLLMAAIDTIGPAAEAKQVTVRTHIESGEAMVIGDQMRLHQVFWNMLSNAIRFTPSGGSVDIHLRLEADQVIVSVSDTGIGIDAAFLPLVFDRFRQADSTTTRLHGGLGLGLAIVRHIVELHGGRVEARSDGVGHGATFTIWLPHMRALASTLTTLPESGIGYEADLHGVRALVVDDDADARELVGVILREAGARPELAGGSTEALALMTSAPPFDVVICDLALPDYDGYRLIAAIRSARSPRQRETPAVAFTAYPDRPGEERARKAGFNAYLAKPIDRSVLTQALGSLLHRAH
jgi:signal transduction histidine kinase/ActR/RegA family two-component response regulator